MKPTDYIAIIGGILVPLLLAARAAWVSLNKNNTTALESIIRIETVITERGQTNQVRHDTVVAAIQDLKQDLHAHTEDDRKQFAEIQQGLKTLEIAGARKQ